MISLFRADLLRLRGRRDVAAIVLGLVLIHAVTFLQAYVIAKTNVDVVTSVPPPPDDAADFIRTQHEYAATALASFAAPMSAASIARPGLPVLLPGVAFLAAVLLGADFEWGTVRGGILLAGSRRRFILVRHVTVWALIALITSCLIVVATAISLGVALTGAPVGWNGQSLPAAAGAVGLVTFQAIVYGSVGVLATTVTRSLAGGLVVASIVLGADALLHSIVGSSQPTLAGLLLSGSVGALGSHDEVSATPISIVVALCWLALVVGASIVAVERRDVLE